jgi:hypothetical protein
LSSKPKKRRKRKNTRRLIKSLPDKMTAGKRTMTQRKNLETMKISSSLNLNYIRVYPDQLLRLCRGRLRKSLAARRPRMKKKRERRRS